MAVQRGGWMVRGTCVAALAAVAVAVVASAARAETTIASDNAGNYGGGWTDGSNGGTGFEPWSLSSGGGTGGFGGNFIGNPTAAEIENFGATAFGQFANPTDSGAFANADRALSQALEVGDVFSFQWAVNFDSDGSGNKGFNLYSGGTGGTQLINVNMGGFPGDITVNGSNTNFAYGKNPMTWSFEMTDATTLSVTATPRDGVGSNYTGSFTVANPPDAFRFYASGLAAGDQRQPYFNNFEVVAVPEPGLALLGLVGLVVPAVSTYRRLVRRARSPQG
jgi:hypothetical protein